MIRRALIHDVFRGRKDAVLNFNYHPSPRAGVGQIICPRWNVIRVTDELKKKGIARLSESYNQLDLFPRNNSLGERRKRALIRHRENTIRNWERCTHNPREEAVARLFEVLLEKAKVTIKQNKEGESEEEDSSGEEDEPTENSSKEGVEQGRESDGDKEKRDPN